MAEQSHSFHKRSSQIVVAFDSTHEALTCEQMCKEQDIPGRLIPTPVEIKADCGLAWVMLPTEKEVFEIKIAGSLKVAGIYELDL